MNQPTDIYVFSRKIDVSTVGARSSDRHIQASEDECIALAKTLNLQRIDRLSADLQLRRLSSGFIEVTGKLSGDVVQTCVVTLEPLTAKIQEQFRLTFSDREDHQFDRDPSEIEIDFDASDPPEPIIDGVIDLGALVAEQLSLALDPYPRKEGAQVSQAFKPIAAEIHQIDRSLETRKPFAGLDKLKK